MKFTKMHGLGNCYVFVDDTEIADTDTDPVAVARKISNRNTGVGSDGLVVVRPPGGTDSQAVAAQMVMYNMDGTRAQMCGNAIRCLGKYLFDNGICRDNPMVIATDSGLLTLELTVREQQVRLVRVDMGAPRLKPRDLPVLLKEEEMIDFPMTVCDKAIPMTCVSMGNPHAVFFVSDLDWLSPSLLEREGTRLEHLQIFPERVNVHFVCVAPSQVEVTVLTWERGSGATQACGTGAAAVCVAGVLTGRSKTKVTVHLPGGSLLVEWNQAENKVMMTGPAVTICAGEWFGMQ